MWLVYNFDKVKKLYRADMFNFGPGGPKDETRYPETGWGETEELAKQDFINKNKEAIQECENITRQLVNAGGGIRNFPGGIKSKEKHGE